jgi:hypothetical protein
MTKGTAEGKSKRVSTYRARQNQVLLLSETNTEWDSHESSGLMR